MRKRIIEFIKDEKGQLMPFLAVSMLIMIGIGILSFTLTKVYSDRMVIRDALDAAAAAALNNADYETNPTEFGEVQVLVGVNQNGDNVYKWEKTEKRYKSRITIDESVSRSSAKAYFSKNMSNNGLQHKIKQWDMQIIHDQNHVVEVYKHRPNTENVYNKTWTEQYPRFVKARITAQVEVPVTEIGAIFGKETMTIALTSEYKKILEEE
jgi:hypothetical protein